MHKPQFIHQLTRITIIAIIVVLAPASFTHAQDATSCKEGFRLFEHKLLATPPVCIPNDPQRIIALENAAVELLLFTDKEIVGTFDAFTKDELSATLPPLTDKLTPITGIGWPANPELMLTLKPDLIVTYENETMPYDQFSQIAPTVIFKAGIAEGNWETATEFWSEVFNVQALYSDMEKTYRARVDELKTAIGDSRADIKVSVVLASSYFNMIQTLDAPVGYILQDVGLGRPESQALNSEAAKAKYGQTTYAYLSDETLDLADGDVIFVSTFAVKGDEAVAASNEYLETFTANPIWQKLNAVQAGKAHTVGYHWTRANTYLQANAVLDDLFTYIAQAKPTIPNPISTFSTATEATPEATEAK